MKSFKEFTEELKEWSVFGKPKALSGKKKTVSFTGLSGTDASRTVSRIDHGDVPDPNKLRTYVTSRPQRRISSVDTAGFSGRDDSRVVQPNIPGTTREKGLFAGKEADVAPYAMPRQSSWLKHGKTLYVPDSQKAAIDKEKVTVNRYTANRFTTLPTGEKFSSNPGKPVSSSQETAGRLLKRYGYNVQGLGTNDFRTAVRRAHLSQSGAQGENIDNELQGYEYKRGRSVSSRIADKIRKRFSEERKLPGPMTADERVMKHRKQAFEKAIKPMKDKFVGKKVEKN